MAALVQLQNDESNSISVILQLSAYYRWRNFHRKTPNIQLSIRAESSIQVEPMAFFSRKINEVRLGLEFIQKL